jgi:hypothetical protein
MHDAPAVPAGNPIPYTAEEVTKRFKDLLAAFDFGAELYELGIGQWSPFKRSQAKKQLTAVHIALWHIALERSFPNDADVFFTHFVTTYPSLQGDKRSAKKLRDLVARYDALVAEKKDTDFTGVADTLVEALGIVETDSRRQRLKLSLRIRSVYEFIFQKMI